MRLLALVSVRSYIACSEIESSEDPLKRLGRQSDHDDPIHHWPQHKLVGLTLYTAASGFENKSSRVWGCVSGVLKELVVAVPCPAGQSLTC